MTDPTEPTSGNPAHWNEVTWEEYERIGPLSIEHPIPTHRPFPPAYAQGDGVVCEEAPPIPSRWHPVRRWRWRRAFGRLLLPATDRAIDSKASDIGRYKR